MVHFAFIGAFLVPFIVLVLHITLLLLIVFVPKLLLVLAFMATLFYRLIMLFILVLVLNFISINMVCVHYSLFGDWYAVDLPDISMARVFACVLEIQNDV